jgi:inosine/xanthosine triphosphatase
MKVAVGSRNPVKIDATRKAFRAVWPEKKWEVAGVDVVSGVSEQPMSDKKSIKGATNRAKRAIKKKGADFGVGLEGGLQKIGRKWFDCGWAVIIDKKENAGTASSVRIETPSKMIKMIKNGMELGEANDKLFGKDNSKQKEGHFGLMSNNLITRTQGYKSALIMALTRFIHPKLWE